MSEERKRNGIPWIAGSALAALMAATGSYLLILNNREPSTTLVTTNVARVSVDESLARRTSDGYVVIGEISDVDLEQIKAIVSPLTSEPLYVIEVTGENAVRVKTGVMRGPLDGDGSFFELRRIDGRWIVEDTGSWVS